MAKVHQTVTYEVRGVPAKKQTSKPGVAPRVIPGCDDAIIVGAGAAGLMAAYRLAGKVRIFESKPNLGGHAASKKVNGREIAPGVMYVSEELKGFARKLGLSLREIPPGSDAYHHVGKSGKVKIIQGVPGKGAEEQLAKFKAFIKYVSEIGPELGDPAADLPKLSSRAEELEGMSAAKALKPFGKQVEKFVELYCEASFGRGLEEISALGLLYFFYFELGSRYTLSEGMGMGKFTDALADKVKSKHPGKITTGAEVIEIATESDGRVGVTYKIGAEILKRYAKTVIVTTPPSHAAKVVREMPEAKRKLIEKMEWSQYLVINVIAENPVFKGRPICEWLPKELADFVAIVSRDNVARLSYPLPQKKAYREKEILGIAKKALSQLEDLIPQLKDERKLRVDVQFWPNGYQIAHPGFSEVVKVLRQPDGPRGQILYAGQALTIFPYFEGALWTGEKAAKQAERIIRKS